jgi:uncharacterized membrane protein (Fun14 family)
MSIESFGPAAATLGGGFFIGILIGYALIKVIKIAASIELISDISFILTKAF